MKRRNIIIGIIALLVLIQFFQIDKTNPPSDPKMDFIALEKPPANISAILKNACYDCHSNSTAYPWYTSIQPLAWWIRSHIRGGKQHLNFAEWGTYELDKKAHKMEEIAEEVEEKHMPTKSYTWMHAEAKLTDDQRKALAEWMRSK